MILQGNDSHESQTYRENGLEPKLYESFLGDLWTGPTTTFSTSSKQVSAMSKFSSGRFCGTRGTRDDGFRKVNGFTTRINADRQGKHIPGHKNYIPGRSILHLSISEAQRLVEEYAGSGRWFEPNKEIVEFRNVIGVWKTKGRSGGALTTRGTIHYSKSGCHIVPAQPEKEDKSDR